MGKDFCAPCLSNNKYVESAYRCLNCQEDFCSTCGDSHKGMKMSRNHQLIDSGIEIPEKIKNLPPNSCADHEDLAFETFCVNHDKMCCRKCLEGHQTCENVISLESASRGVKQSSTFAEANDDIEHVLTALGELESGYKENIERIEQESTDIRENIRHAKEELIDTIEYLVRSLNNDLDRIKQTQIDERSEIHELITTTKKYKDAFRFTEEKGSDEMTFRLLQRSKTDISSIQECLVEISKNGKKVRPRFKKDIHFNSSMKLGSIETVEDEPHTAQFIPRKLSQSQIPTVMCPQASFPISSFAFLQEFQHLTQLLKSHHITGMTFSGDTLLLCDYNNHRIVTCDSSGNYQCIIKTSHTPWDISAISGTNMAVISRRDAGNIHFIDIKNKEVLNEVNGLKGRGGGIYVTDTNIILGGEGKVTFLDHTGKMDRNIAVNAKRPLWYLTKCPNRNVCFTESYDSGVYFVNEEGESVSTYKSENLKTPMKMVSDDQGNVYVVGHSSNNIHRLSPDGKFIDVVLDKKDGIDNPNTLCFNEDFTKLYISNKKGASIIVFSANRS